MRAVFILIGVIVTPPCVGLGAMGTKDRGGVVFPRGVVLPPGLVGVVLLAPEENNCLRAEEPGEHRRSWSEDRGDSPTVCVTFTVCYVGHICMGFISGMSARVHIMVYCHRPTNAA